VKGEVMIGRIERWAPISGIVFVVLMVVGSMLVGDVPGPNAPEPEIADYLADSANHTRNIVGAYIWGVGALVFLGFLTRLRSELRKAEGATGALTNLAFGVGVAFTAVWIVSAATFVSVAYAIALRDAPLSDPDLVRVLPTTGRLLLLLGGGFAGSLFVLAASVVILRTRVFARWVGWLGIVVGIALLFDLVYSTLVPLWVWVFIASIVMFRPRKETATTRLGVRREETATSAA
jgi:hypothetical protein